MTTGLLDPAGLPGTPRGLPITGWRALDRLNLARTALPAPLRPDAALAVCDVTEFYGRTSGGVRTYLDRKAAYVALHAHLRQVVVVPGDTDAVQDADGVRLYRLRGPRVPMQPPYRFMLALRQPRRIVEHERPHVVEIGSPGLVPWVVRFATRRRGTPLVHFWHSHYPRQLAGADGRGRLGSWAWRYARHLDRLFARTIVASDYAARELAAAGIDRVVRVPLGVDLEHFHPWRRARTAQTRAAFGLPLHLPLALFVGRFAREKHLDVLLRGWGAVRRRTGARLVLLGEGPDRARLAALPEAQHAIWLPFVSDRARVADLMAASELLVAPSPMETFGLAVLEAMACGTTVLAADAGGGGELVTRSGGGATFPAGDPHALGAAALALFDRGAVELHALGRTARRHAEREHAWDRVFDRLFAVYREVVNEGAAP